LKYSGQQALNRIGAGRSSQIGQEPVFRIRMESWDGTRGHHFKKNVAEM
jgi:hypothetical protein